MTRAKSRSSVRGFSLVELGIVIAAIAVLSAIVIASRGFIDAAKYKTAVEMVGTLRTEAREFAMRNFGGLNYGPNGGPNMLSLDNLRGQGFVPAELRTNPWGGGLSIGANSTADAVLCAANSCVQIQMTGVPDDNTPNGDCQRLAAFFAGNAQKGIAGQTVGKPSCATGTFTAVFR